MPTEVNIHRNMAASFPPLQRPAPGPRLTYREIGEIFGVSMRRVQQIEVRALAKLKAAIQQEAEAAGVTPAEWMTGDQP